MNRIPNPAPRTHLRLYLLAGYTLFIVYVSLSPFDGWQAQGLDFATVLTAPLKQTYTWFDATINGIAYLPFGWLLALCLRPRLPAPASVVLATTGGLLLSASMEYAQLYLPTRISSNLDLLTNSSGSLIGALLASSLAAALLPRIRNWRQTAIQDNSDFGLALVALWMFAQINPSLPMLGNVFISELVRKPFTPPPPEIFNWLESIAVTLNLLMLGSLLLLLLRERRQALTGLIVILSLVALVKFIAAAALLKSWALLLWLNSEAMLGLACGLFWLVVALGLSVSGVRRLAWLSCGSYLLLTHVVLDASAPSSAMPLYQWRYAHLLNYNGLTQTVVLIFPFLLLGYLWRQRRPVYRAL